MKGPRRHGRSGAPVVLPLLAVVACSGDTPAGIQGEIRLTFSTSQLDLGLDRSGELEIQNAGSRAVGPITLSSTGILDAGGTQANGVTLRSDPPEIPTLNPGSAALIRLSVSVDESAAPGFYGATLRAIAQQAVVAAVGVRLEVLDPEAVGVVDVRFVDVPEGTRRGDVLPLHLHAERDDGTVLQDPKAVWTLEPPGAGFVDQGRFVGYTPGPVHVSARVGTVGAGVTLEVTSRGGPTVAFEPLAGTVAPMRITSDLWVHGDHGYTGTWRGSTTTGVEPGNVLFVWDISDPVSLRLTDSIKVDARTVNDVKIRADGTLGILSHEGSTDGLNGVTFFTLDDPAHPTVVSRFTQGLESGIHNAWLDGDYAYLVVDGIGSGLRVLDVSDPAEPRTAASFYGGSSFLHDVYVRDGFAFLSHWNAGLIVLDVGNGIAGGSPTDPREVSRLAELSGQTHNAWYWPEGGYVFVGEEDFSTPGIMHVVDLHDPFDPHQVATFAVSGQTPHNFWMDEERQILYMAWYDKGVRALDVSGELLGDLARAGREVGVTLDNGPRIFAPQLHHGLLFAADMLSALQVVRPMVTLP